jgi:hypothetical protein
MAEYICRFFPVCQLLAGKLGERRRNCSSRDDEGIYAQSKSRPGACNCGFDGKDGLGGLFAQIPERRTNGKVELRHGR